MLPAFESKTIERKTLPIWMGRWKTTLREGDWKVIAKFEDYIPSTSFNDYLVHRKLTTFELYNLKKDPNETEDLSQANTDILKEMTGLIEDRVVSVQKEIVAWNGLWVLPYEVARMYNPKLPSKKEFSKLSPEEQDLMKSVE